LLRPGIEKVPKTFTEKILNLYAINANKILNLSLHWRFIPQTADILWSFPHFILLKNSPMFTGKLKKDFYE